MKYPYRLILLTACLILCLAALAACGEESAAGPAAAPGVAAVEGEGSAPSEEPGENGAGDASWELGYVTGADGETLEYTLCSLADGSREPDYDSLHIEDLAETDEAGSAAVEAHSIIIRVVDGVPVQEDADAIAVGDYVLITDSASGEQVIIVLESDGSAEAASGEAAADAGGNNPEGASEDAAGIAAPAAAG